MTTVVLTPQQEAVLELASLGLTNKQIAHELNLSPRTVEIHTEKAVERLEARNRVHAVVKWERAKIARRAEEQRQQAAQQAQALAESRKGFVHCPTCGGNGFVRGQQP